MHLIKKNLSITPTIVSSYEAIFEMPAETIAKMFIDLAKDNPQELSTRLNYLHQREEFIMETKYEYLFIHNFRLLSKLIKELNKAKLPQELIKLPRKFYQKETKPYSLLWGYNQYQQSPYFY